jgi:hypothetical protein
MMLAPTGNATSAALLIDPRDTHRTPLQAPEPFGEQLALLPPNDENQGAWAAVPAQRRGRD